MGSEPATTASSLYHCARGEGVFVVAPPYVKLANLRLEASEPGSILAVDLERSGLQVPDCRSLQLMWPWCPVVIASSERLDQRVLDAFALWPGSLASYARAPYGSMINPDFVRNAVSQRCAPSPGDIAAYVVLRTQRPEIGPVLRMSASQADAVHPTPHRSTLSRQLRQFGSLTAHDWRAIFALASVAQVVRRGTRMSASGTAYEHGMDPRTLRRRIRYYLGCSFDSLEALIGWEWLVESVLSRWDYINGHSPRLAAEVNTA